MRPVYYGVPVVRSCIHTFRSLCLTARPFSCCQQCDGELKIIATIEGSAVIVRILTHLVLPARAATLTGAARACVMQSHKVECSPLGSMQSPKNHASGEFAPNTARLSACWAAIELRTVKRSVEIFYSHPRPGIYTMFLPGAGSAMPSSPARAADCVANDRRLTTRSMS